MYVWFLQVVCFYVVIEALEALEAQTKTVTVRSLLLVFIIGIWLLERNLNMLGLAN